MSIASGVYVFCAIREKQAQRFGTVVLNGKERLVYTVHYENVAFVVCDVEGDALPSRDNLMAHQKVISQVMNHHTVIPMSFGNVFSSKEDVLYIAQHLVDQFEWLFPELENKMEVGLKIIANQRWLDDEMAKDSVLQESIKAANSKPAAAAFYDRIKIGELAQEFIFSLQKKIESDVYRPLSHLAASSKLNSLLSEKMLLNAAFLIDRKHEEEFDAKVNELYEEWKEKVEFKYSGPWAPYNFVHIKLKIEGKA